MPEGPEVRRYALQLQDALEGRELIGFTARNKGAKAWLLEHHERVLGRKITKVRSHGKHLYGVFEGDIGFHSHLMMWGRWWVYGGDEAIEVDRRERARLVTPQSVAILTSAPVFEIFEGDPYAQIDNLATLGPDILPSEGDPFDSAEFVRRLQLLENLEREIGAILLDQRVLAGVGNYLRADALFLCQINPYTRVSALTRGEVTRLCEQIPLMARRALAEAGVSIPPEMRERLLRDETLSYNGRIVEWAARHATFRRTNLPCLVCGAPIKQKQQIVWSRPGEDEEEPGDEKARTIYFCPVCQNVDVDSLVTPRKSVRKKSIAPKKAAKPQL